MSNINNENEILNRTKKCQIVFVIIMISGICWFWYKHFSNSYFIKYPKRATFTKLEKTRNQKKETVINYLNKQSIKGNQISENKDVIKSFKELLLLYKQKAYSSLKYSQIEMELEKLFVVDLDEFYDLLFINKEGDIFFTIKKENDFLSNIYENRFDNIDLYKIIRDKATTETMDNVLFVDYDYYPVSAEPASFFIAPVREQGQVIGYVVLQLAINQINNILTDRTSAGRTEEVYLVNKKHFMMTQSRFIDGVTSLKKMIDTDAVKNALAHGKGNEIISDYRGKRVFSSYEKFDYKGAEWIIIAEIDEDEVVTDLYLACEDELFEKSVKYLEQYPFVENHQLMPEYLKTSSNKIKVDIKEVMKSRNNEVFYTRGVSTCTALTVAYPGQFGYLSHITPTDEVYEDVDWTTKLFLKDKQTDFVGNLMANISMVDISEHEKAYLKFGVFSTVDKSLKNIIHKLVTNEIDLSQIKIVYQKQYDLVNIIFDYDKNQVWSQWKGQEIETSYHDHYSEVSDFGEIIKKVSNYEMSSKVDS